MRTAALVLLLPLAALGKEKVAIDGPKPIVNQLIAALKKHYTGVGVKKEMPENPAGGDVKRAAGESGARAVLMVRKTGSSYTVMVLDASDGGLLEQIKVKSAGNKLKMNKEFESKLINAVGRAEGPKAEAPPKKEPEPEPTKPEPKETKSEPKETRPEPVAEKPEEKSEPKEETVVSEKIERKHTGEELPFVRAAVGGRLFSRRLYWNQDLYKALAKYDLPAAPMAGLDVDFFPGALVSQGPAAWVGINGSFDYALGLGSQASDQVKYSTTALRLRLGLIGRVPIGDLLEIRPALGWMMQSFSIKATGGAKPPLPDVNYSNLRVGTDLAVKVTGPFSFFAGAFYEQPLSVGEMKTYFPALSVGGFDADLGVALVFGSIEVRASVDYTRFWYSMNVKPGDPHIAGGAIDDYKGANLTVGFML